MGDRPKAVYIPPLGLYIYYIGHMAIYKTSKFGKNHNFWNKIQQKLVVDQSRKGISTIGKHPKWWCLLEHHPDVDHQNFGTRTKILSHTPRGGTPPDVDFWTTSKSLEGVPPRGGYPPMDVDFWKPRFGWTPPGGYPPGCRFLETPIWMDPPGGGTPPDVDFWTTPGISIFGQPPKVWGVPPPFLKNPGFWSFSKKGGLTPQFLGVTEFCKFYQIFEGGSKKLSKKGQICHLYVFFTPPENDVFS